MLDLFVSKIIAACLQVGFFLCDVMSMILCPLCSLCQELNELDAHVPPSHPYVAVFPSSVLTPLMDVEQMGIGIPVTPGFDTIQPGYTTFLKAPSGIPTSDVLQAPPEMQKMAPP